MCRVTLAEIQRPSALWYFTGDTLFVKHYPHWQEEEVKAKRIAGKIGGSVKSQAKTEAAKINGSKGGRPSFRNGTQAGTEAEPNVKGREGKGKEKKEEERQETQDRNPGTGSQGSSLNSFPSRATTPALKANTEEGTLARDRLRFLVARYGATQYMQGKDIMHEWFDAAKTHDINFVAERFDEAGPNLPSDLRRILKKHDQTGSYQRWLEERRKVTA